MATCCAMVRRTIACGEELLFVVRKMNEVVGAIETDRVQLHQWVAGGGAQKKRMHQRVGFNAPDKLR
mgnify:CR=1 FL=1